jgi:hypothetical protein
MRKALLSLTIILIVVANFWLRKQQWSVNDFRQLLATAATPAPVNTPDKYTTTKDEWCNDLMNISTDSAFVAQFLHTEDNIVAPEDEKRFQQLAPVFEKTIAPTQYFTADANKTILLKGKNGTKITLPVGCFLLPNNQVATGAIQLQLKELYDASSLLLANLPTLTDYGILTSDGTVYLNALTADNQVLKITKNCTVEIPTALKETNRWLFYGNHEANGKLRWIASAGMKNTTPTTDTDNYYNGDESASLTPPTTIQLGQMSEQVAQLWQYVQRWLGEAPHFHWLGFDPANSTEPAEAYTPASTISDDANYAEYSDPTPREFPTGKRLPRTGNTFSLNQTGWFSINRYEPYHAGKRTIVAQINNTNDMVTSMFLIMKNRDVVIASEKTADGNFVFQKVPRGQRAYMVALGYQQKQTFVDIVEITTGEKPVETLSLRPTTIDQLKYQVSQLH